MVFAWYFQEVGSGYSCQESELLVPPEQLFSILLSLFVNLLSQLSLISREKGLSSLKKEGLCPLPSLQLPSSIASGSNVQWNNPKWREKSQSSCKKPNVHHLTTKHANNDVQLFYSTEVRCILHFQVYCQD